MADDSNEELKRLEDVLMRPDYVLEPKAYPTLRQYLTAGGTPQGVVMHLSDGYHGYAHMAALMSQWLTGFAEPGQDGPSASVPSGPSTSGRSAQDAGKALPPHTDEAWFLKEVVKERFSADKVADVFGSRQGKAPTWLEGLTSDPRGRALVYELSAGHRNCLLLNFAIQKILMQGHEDEVAVVGASLASYFSVFHRLLAARLRAALTALTPSPSQHTHTNTGPSNGSGAGQSSVTLPTISRELTESCSKATHTYLHAQQLLRTVGRHPRGAAFLRLSQELEMSTARDHPAVWNTQRMLLPPGSSSSLVEAATLVGRILAHAPIIPAREIVALETLYRHVPGAHVRPLAPLQHAGFITQLLKGVFTPHKPCTPEVSSAAIELLSLATSYPLDTLHSDSDEGQHTGGGEDPLWGDDEQHGNTEHPSLLSALTSPLLPPDHGTPWDAQGMSASSRVHSTAEALRGVITLGSKLAAGKVAPEDYHMVQRVASVPVASAALLESLHSLLAVTGPERSWEEQNILIVPDCLRMTLMVASQQRQLLQNAIDLITDCGVSIGSQQTMDVAHAFTGALVVIMRDMGAVTQVMAALDRWSKSADPSMVRHMILQVLASISPPYSVPMAQWLLHHMVTSGIRRKRETKETLGSMELLRAFAVTALAMGAAGPGGARAAAGTPRLVIGPKEQALLSELASTRAA